MPHVYLSEEEAFQQNLFTNQEHSAAMFPQAGRVGT